MTANEVIPPFPTLTCCSMKWIRTHKWLCPCSATTTLILHESVASPAPSDLMADPTTSLGSWARLAQHSPRSQSHSCRNLQVLVPPQSWGCMGKPQLPGWGAPTHCTQLLWHPRAQNWGSTEHLVCFWRCCSNGEHQFSNTHTHACLQGVSAQKGLPIPHSFITGWVFPPSKTALEIRAGAWLQLHRSADHKGWLSTAWPRPAPLISSLLLRNLRAVLSSFPSLCRSHRPRLKLKRSILTIFPLCSSWQKRSAKYVSPSIINHN